MKHSMSFTLAALLVVAGTGVCQAETEPGDVVEGMGKKLVRGVVNTVTGVVELPVQTIKGYKSGVGFIKNETGSKTVGTVLGFFRGIGHAAGRTAHGVVDVVGFWAANPESNDGVGIPLDAEYAWEEGTRYSIMKPTLKEGLMPYPRKLVRGLGDSFLGILELPGQVLKGVRDDGVAGLPMGLVKGVWFSSSRVVSGADAVLFLAPNPEDQLGYVFEQAWPWESLTE
jgi:putative exosortase-associated protein (TIGR04073 family)